MCSTVTKKLMTQHIECFRALKSPVYDCLLVHVLDGVQWLANHLVRIMLQLVVAYYGG